MNGCDLMPHRHFSTRSVFAREKEVALNLNSITIDCHICVNSWYSLSRCGAVSITSRLNATSYRRHILCCCGSMVFTQDVQTLIASCGCVCWFVCVSAFFVVYVFQRRRKWLISEETEPVIGFHHSTVVRSISMSFTTGQPFHLAPPYHSWIHAPGYTSHFQWKSVKQVKIQTNIRMCVLCENERLMNFFFFSAFKWCIRQSKRFFFFWVNHL